MKKLIVLLVVAVAAIQVQAQEALISDSGQIAPFEGIIGYHIRYEGKVPPNMIPYLPDSMTMFVGKNGLLYRYHGGHASEMQSQLVWDGDAQEFWLLDPKHETAESRWEAWKSLIAKPVKVPKESLIVAGKRCDAWTLTTEKKVDTKVEKQVEKLWVNDSIFFGGTLVDSLKSHQPAFLAAGIRQIPLQSRRGHAGEIVTVLTAITITPGPQNIWLFKTPESYRMKEFDPIKPWHPLIQRKKE
jgi:hypothetical protein